MRKFNAALLVIIILTVITLVVVFAPVDKIIETIPYFKKLYTNTSLSVNSPNGKAAIKINDKEYGETNQVIQNLPEGDYTVTLSRISDSNSFYQDATFSVSLYRNTEAFIDIELWPAGQSSGYVTYYSPSPSTTEATGFISIRSNISGADVLLNGQLIGNSPVISSKQSSGNYTVKVAATGYDDIEVPVIIRDNYNLNLEVFLTPKAIILNE